MTLKIGNDKEKALKRVKVILRECGVFFQTAGLMNGKIMYVYNINVSFTIMVKALTQLLFTPGTLGV